MVNSLSARATIVALQTLEDMQVRIPSPSRQWLDEGEWQRFTGITQARLRQRFLAGHWLAREALAQLTQSDPDRWRLRAAASGAPLAFEVSGNHLAHVSISHSGAYLACAASFAPVGIDIEAPQRERDLIALAQRMFPASEVETLAALDSDAQHSAFYRRWTLDEAHAKREGDGLASERSQRQFWLNASHDAATARSWRGDGWFLALCVAVPEQMHGAEMPEGYSQGMVESAWHRMEYQRKD